MYELEDVRKLRKRMGMTQQELARKAGVSQSLLAKIETGRISPGYERVRRIFAALDEVAKKKETKAGVLATKKVISAGPGESAAAVIRKMRLHKISQMPVLDDGKPVGLVTETGLLEKISGGMSPGKTAVSEVMEDAPPTVSEKAGMEAVVGLLKHFPIVLVSKEGKVTGVVTKSDVLARAERE
jgi:predicted transcriptional regulator